MKKTKSNGIGRQYLYTDKEREVMQKVAELLKPIEDYISPILSNDELTISEVADICYSAMFDMILLKKLGI